MKTKEKTDPPNQCSACGWKTTELNLCKADAQGKPPEEHRYWCNICYNSGLGDITVHNSTEAEGLMAQAIGYIGNMILNRIESTRRYLETEIRCK